MTPLFQLCTFFTDEEEYRRLRASAREAGFVEPETFFTGLDNSGGNRFDPYQSLPELAASSPAEYLLCAHQDVRFDRGDGRGRLLAALDELSQLAPDWAVCGNAGLTSGLEVAARITDPGAADLRIGPFPRQVISLDENLLVLRTGASPTLSRELRGFHFYGTDLCLHGEARGRSAWVVDFHITHLSSGKITPHFLESREAFRRRWSPHFRFRFVQTTCAILFLSRHPWLARLMNSRRVLHRMTFNRHFRRGMLALQARLQPSAAMGTPWE